MGKQLATLSVSVLLKDGQIEQATRATNVPNLTFWKQVVDAMWAQEVSKRAGRKPEPE